MIQRIITNVMLNILIHKQNINYPPPPTPQKKYYDMSYKLYIIEEQFLTIVN